MKLLFIISAFIFSASVMAINPTTDKEFTTQVIQHSGGTDKCGCHYNRKTGEYHCHKRKKRGGDCPP